MKPLKVTFQITTPLVEPEYPIHLDALLAFVRVQREQRFDAQEELPLAREVRAEDWVWKASALHFAPAERHRRVLTRRTDVDTFARDQGEVHRYRGNGLVTGSGPFKNYLFTYPLLESRTAVAWCVGEPDDITDLLGDLRYLGKRSRLGHGEIRRFDIEEDPDAASFWRRRVLPWRPDEEIGRYVPHRTRVRPPYWGAENRRFCWLYNPL